MVGAEMPSDFEELCRRLLDEIAAEAVPPRIADLARELAQRLDSVREAASDDLKDP